MVTAITGDVVHLTRIVQITRLCQVAPSALMAYDYSGFDRYGISAPSLDCLILQSFCLTFLANCHTFLIVQGWPSCLIIWLVQIILQMRLYALYDHSRKVMLVMGIAFMVEVLAMATILMLSNVSSGILHQRKHAKQLLYFLASGPVLRVATVFPRYLGRHPAIKRRTETNGNIQQMNAVMWATLPVCILAWFLHQTDVGKSQEEWIEVPEGFPHATAVISGCRLILHIRNAASPPFSDEDTFHESRLAFVYPMR
ncbi:hypothetical protein J3A83DRAFT_4184820 [Scleroderma citrinum]